MNDRLEHPLPAGMRDLLPEETVVRRGLARVVEGQLGAHGYHLVTPPAFELADVIERGLGPLSAGDVLRFVEPESGEVCVLRPDLTPQIARIAATRLRDRPPPYRLAYEGTVVRRRLGRAKKSRQIPQIGVELCGLGAPDGDLEILALAADALRATGLARFTIDIADAGIVRGLLADAEAERVSVVMGALARKDESVLAEATRELAHGDALRALPQLHGGRDALVEANARLASTPAAGAAKRLLALFEAASRILGDVLVADAGEVRGFAYYTGLLFSIYAPGPGDAIGGGGRYDELLGRFGAPMPAVGFGLDLDALTQAIHHAGASVRPRPSVVVVGSADDPTLATLRSAGMVAVAVADEASALAYARAWGYGAVVHAGKITEVVEHESRNGGADAARRVLEKAR